MRGQVCIRLHEYSGRGGVGTPPRLVEGPWRAAESDFASSAGTDMQICSARVIDGAPRPVVGVLRVAAGGAGAGIPGFQELSDQIGSDREESRSASQRSPGRQGRPGQDLRNGADVPRVRSVPLEPARWLDARQFGRQDQGRKSLLVCGRELWACGAFAGRRSRPIGHCAPSWNGAGGAVAVWSAVSASAAAACWRLFSMAVRRR